MGMNSFACLEGTMPIDPSFWGYNNCNETITELNQKLHDTTMELQTFQLNALVELKRKEDCIQKLNFILNKTCQERDEARQNLQLLLNKLASESPQITKSDSISYNSSPIDSFLDPENSPDLSNNINMADSSNININGAAQRQLLYNNMSQCDQAYARLEHIAMNKPLPEKGKLVEAVMKAGPLLQTLLVAGPLPRWKNPPPVMPVQIPSIAVDNPNSHINPHILNDISNGGHAMMMAKRSVAMASPCMSFKRQKPQ